MHSESQKQRFKREGQVGGLRQCALVAFTPRRMLLVVLSLASPRSPCSSRGHTTAMSSLSAGHIPQWHTSARGTDHLNKYRSNTWNQVLVDSGTLATRTCLCKRRSTKCHRACASALNHGFGDELPSRPHLARLSPNPFMKHALT